MKILAIVNQKGGVGKTTTAINLAASLAAMKRRVLLIDLDPQGNATTGSGINKHQLKKSMYDVLLKAVDPKEAVIKTDSSGYDLLPANLDLSALQISLLEQESREYQLKEVLEEIKNNYQYIFIDCPPSLNILTINALVAAEGVFIPVQCEYFALEGLSDLLHTISQLQDHLHLSLKVEGLVRTLCDPRSRLTQDVSEELNKHFSDKLYRTMIPRNVRLAEAPSAGKPVLAFDKSSKGAQAYLALAGELTRRLEEAQNKNVDAI